MSERGVGDTAAPALSARVELLVYLVNWPIESEYRWSHGPSTDAFFRGIEWNDGVNFVMGPESWSTLQDNRSRRCERTESFLSTPEDSCAVGEVESYGPIRERLQIG